MQGRRTSRTSISACFVVNTRLRRSLLNRLRGSLLSGSLRGCLLDGRLRSYRRLLNRLSLLRGRRRTGAAGASAEGASVAGACTGASVVGTADGVTVGEGDSEGVADALGVGEELGVAEADAEADVDDDEAEGVTFGARTDEEQPVSSRAPARTPAVAA